ncbi:MAG TPA: L-threonylcarbamoyladenylate synthase [Candidatus Glassbacteria bacterium]|nr:L-threonylcarbamoyladenylate synthase [Candidatus Glassbacteria bacterium]
MKKTILLKVDPNKPDLSKIKVAANIIKKGGLVAFPTETVYGLGADALNSKAILSLFKAKNRPIDNPPIIHVENLDQIKNLAKEIPIKAKLLIEKFWPGPLTIVFQRSENIPIESTAGLDTIAIRMPQHKVALALIKKSKCPIAAPSANISGKPSPTLAKHVFDDLNGKIDAILDGGPTCIGVESTVVNITVNPPEVLRPGGISIEDLKKTIGDIKIHPFVLTDKQLTIEKIRSPGMKHKHYAPKAKVILVEGAVLLIIKKVTEIAKQYMLKELKVGILATQETVQYYNADIVKSLGSRFNLKGIAHNLFSLLREFDDENVDIIVAEGVPSEGVGLAIMNRLRKAAAYNIVKT